MKEKGKGKGVWWLGKVKKQTIILAKKKIIEIEDKRQSHGMATLAPVLVEHHHRPS